MTKNSDKRTLAESIVRSLFGESLNINEINNAGDPNDLPAHLKSSDDPTTDDEGPVPPNSDGDPHVVTDPYVRFFVPKM